MKKQLLLITGFVCLATIAFGGGIYTNTNQSAAWVRTLNRDASTGADAVYFNPAGLIKLDDGFHFSLNSQTIIQNKDVTRNYEDYTLLSPVNPKKFEGDVLAPVFPGFYATWKKSKIAVSFGFNPIGGGGGAEYAEGLPSFESQLSLLVPTMSGVLGNFDAALTPAYGFNPDFNNITGFSADIYFKGTSVFFGYQLGLTYQINDVFSVYAGGRLVTAKNTYEGHIRDVQVDAAPNQAGVPALYNTPARSYTPGDYFNAVSQATGLAGTSNELLLQGIGAALQTAAADQEVDAEETGNGFAPILGINIAPNEKLNIGLKYEFKTKMDLTTTVNDDKGAGLFVQDSTVNSDMPAMASVGISYKILSDLRASAGFHYYWDKNANYGKTLDATGEQVTNDELMDNNFFEVSLGLEYDITAKLLVSGGWLHANTGVTEDYQSDLSFSLTSNTFGIGLGYKFTEKLMINLGGALVTYQEDEKAAVNTATGQPYTDTYFKDALFFGIGVDFSF